MLEIIGQVDRGHAALTKLTLDGVAAFEGRVQSGDGIRHGQVFGSCTPDVVGIFFCGGCLDLTMGPR